MQPKKQQQKNIQIMRTLDRHLWSTKTMKIIIFKSTSWVFFEGQLHYIILYYPLNPNDEQSFKGAI